MPVSAFSFVIGGTSEASMPGDFLAIRTTNELGDSRTFRAKVARQCRMGGPGPRATAMPYADL
eukprot:594399-Heterocapsa_arctica.AAC.1